MKRYSFAKSCSKAFLISLFAFLADAKAQKVFFQQLTMSEGLPSDYVNTIYEDQKGSLWIGTDKGVCSYDGMKFNYFTKENGLTSNFIDCITSDPSGNIWFGTFEGGLCKFDGTKINPFPLPGDIEFWNIFGILFNPDGSFFLITGAFNLYFFENEKAPPRKLMGTGPYFISSLGNDRFFVCSPYQAVYLLEKVGNNFSCRELWHVISAKDRVLGTQSHGRFVVMHQGKLWIYTLDERDNVHGRQAIVNSKFKIGEENSFYSRGNEIWLGTYNGLLYIDKDDKTHFMAVDQGLPGNYVNAICEDRQQNIYVCTFGGGIRIWPQFYLKEFALEGKVNSIYPGLKSVYISTTKAVYEYLPDRKPELLPNLRFDNFSNIYQSDRGSIFLGTYNSFFRLPNDLALRKLSLDTRKKFEYNTHMGVSGFYEQKDGHLFVSTYGDGIKLFDQNNHLLKTYSHKNQLLATGLVEFLKPMENSMGALTYNFGLTVMDSTGHLETISKKEGLLSNTVHCIYQEWKEKLWIGTLHGLNLFDGKRVSKTFSYTEGFVGSKVLCIFRDNQNRFWVLSDKCLHLLEGEKLRAIGSHPVLFDSKNSINRAAYDTAKGLLYLGLNDALEVVDVSKIVPDSIVRVPTLKSVISGDSILNKNKKSAQVTLNPDIIRFQFANRYYPLDQKAETYYKLKGYDDDWKVLENASLPTYQKLPPGKFELLAKTINPDGYGSPTVSLIQFEILPPVWKRTWFILMSISLLMITVFYAANKFSRKRFEGQIRQMEQAYRLQLERERIARELHDNVGSQLTYLINKIEDVSSHGVDKSELEMLSDFARGAMRELRETIWALDKKVVSLEDLQNKLKGLSHLYRSEKQNVELEWNSENPSHYIIRSLEALNIFRIVQEALNNAMKYSQAPSIRVLVNADSRDLQVSIQDNGQGFCVKEAESGYGLQNMRKRAEEMNARLNIESHPGSGTRVTLTISKNQPFS